MEEQVETSGQKVLEKAKWKDLRSKQTNQQKLKKKNWPTKYQVLIY